MLRTIVYCLTDRIPLRRAPLTFSGPGLSASHHKIAQLAPCAHAVHRHLALGPFAEAASPFSPEPQDWVERCGSAAELLRPNGVSIVDCVLPATLDLGSYAFQILPGGRCDSQVLGDFAHLDIDGNRKDVNIVYAGVAGLGQHPDPHRTDFGPGQEREAGGFAGIQGLDLAGFE